MTENLLDTNQLTLPLLVLRGKTLFPKIILNFEVGRPKSVVAVGKAYSGDKLIFIAPQKKAFIDNPEQKDVLEYGVVAKINQVVKIPGNALKVSVEAKYRAKIVRFENTETYFSATVEEAPYINGDDELLTEAGLRVAKKAFLDYAFIDKKIGKEIITTLSMIENPNEFIDNALSVVNLKEHITQNMLCLDDTEQRLNEFTNVFVKENELLKLEKKINGKVKSSIDKSQKEFYLREQLKAIHSELGDDQNEVEVLTQKIKDKNLPKEINDKALKEIQRLQKINPSSPDYSIILNYLDWILDLPFNDYTFDTENLLDARKVLDKDHFGLEKVKQRIVEYLAVLKLTKQIKGPILCFVGPPGVGKTSIATSIARALNRKFVRMSLGGVKDEAEIRGHRKTYVGAMPGRIVVGLKNAGSMNPVFLLDEIDKLSRDIHGDPSSALLEVLDPEQNATFRDRYLEVPLDLSKVMFITTANSIETIPQPLLDRMEVIEINGYTNEEKLQIAQKYLIPKQIKLNGLKASKVAIKDQAVKEIIEGYTMEAGVRNLEREIGSVIRKIAVKFAEDENTKKQTVKPEDVDKHLGIRKFLKDKALDKDEIGTATGLAWTAVGGTTLAIEVCLLGGKGEIVLTGKLGDVMKESARAAISYIHSCAENYSIDEENFKTKDIHIHVPEGATPKDGPSAGITMATAILSAMTGKPVKKSVAMTGEITLRGKVLPIGGLKEKALAAYRQGIKDVIIPKENQKDIADIPEEIRKEINFIAVDSADKAFSCAIKF